MDEIAADGAPETDAAAMSAAPKASDTPSTNGAGRSAHRSLMPVEEVSRLWIGAWATGNRRALFDLLAAGANVESNLDPDGDFVEILHEFLAAIRGVTVVSENVVPIGAGTGRVALVYDCAAPTGTVRVAEFLEVRGGLVHEVRRVYDLVAVLRLLPHLA